VSYNIAFNTQYKIPANIHKQPVRKKRYGSDKLNYSVISLHFVGSHVQQQPCILFIMSIIITASWRSGALP